MRLDKRAVAPDHDKTGIFLNLTDNYPVAIAATRTGRNDRPVEEQKIASITVDTHGEVYPEPNKLPDPYGRF